MNLERACRRGDVSAIGQILHRNPNLVNCMDAKIGWSPLYRSVICKHFEAAKSLLNKGADPNLQNKLGETPLHKAAEIGAGRITKLLLDNGANPNIWTNEGDTVLHIASLKQHTKIAILLLKRGGDPNIKDKKQGKTPLHYAVELNSTKLVEAMMICNASPLETDNDGKSALDSAITSPIQRVLVEPPQGVVDSLSTFDLMTPLNTQEFLEGENDLSPIFGARDQANLDYWDVKVEEPPELPKNDTLQEPEAEKLDVPKYIVDDEITFGSNCREQSPILYGWLNSIKLEDVYDTLIRAGYDDIDLMSEQMHSHMPITSETLYGIGIHKFGLRQRLLAHLLFPNALLHPEPVRINKKSGYACLTKTSAEIFVNISHPSIEDWLQGLDLRELIPVFMEAGFNDHADLLYLMQTPFALTDQMLKEDLKIEKQGYRHRILIALQQDLSNLEKAKIEAAAAEESACKSCLLM